MIGSGRETLSNVRKALLDIQEWSVGSPGCPGVVRRPSWLSGSSGRPSRMFGCCLETLPDVPEVWEVLPDVRQLL